MSSSSKVYPSKTEDSCKNSLTSAQKSEANGLKLDPVQVYKATEADYSNLTKYTFNSSQCPITNFTLTQPEIKTPTKEQLANKYYKYVDSTPKTISSNISLSLPEKTETDLIKPTNVKIKFNGTDSTPQFDYISEFTTPSSDWKILNHITSALSHFNFIDSSDSSLPVYQSLCSLQNAELLSQHELDKPKKQQNYFQSYGLYGLHNHLTSRVVHNFKSHLNNFIYQTIDRKFNKSNKYSSQNEYLNLFDSIFIQNNKLKSSLVSSLIIPNMINNFLDSTKNESIYSYVPHATSGTYFNNFSSTSNVYNPSSIREPTYIPTYFTTSSISNIFSTSNLTPWNYPFIKPKSIDSNGKLSPNTSLNTIISENMANVIDSQFIIRDSDIQNSTVFDDLHQFTIKSGYKSTTFLNSPSTSTYSKSYDTIGYSTKRVYDSIYVEKVGTMTYNPDKYDGYCNKAGARKYGSGHGDSKDVDVYKLVHDGNTHHEADNIGKNGAPSTSEFMCGNDSTVKPDSMAKYKDIRSRYEYKWTCNGNQNHDCKKCKVANLGDPSTIARNVKSKIQDWGIKYEGSLNISGSSISSINSSLRSLKPYHEIQVPGKTNKTYSYQFGNCLSSAEMDKIKSSVVYAKGSGIKLYSATFGELLSDIYVYDDRFFFILYKYYMTNKNMLCNVLESEILNYVFKHPELLAVYRIQKGYLQYALNNMKTLNAKQILNVVKFDSQDEDTKKEIHEIKNNVSCFMNIECPIIGAMIHSDTLNMVDYNDYVSDSMIMTNDKINVIETNDGKLIAVNLNKFPYTKMNNIDSIYQNCVRSFGKISAHDLTLPGIFISDSGNPIDFIGDVDLNSKDENENNKNENSSKSENSNVKYQNNFGIEFVDVDGDGAQKTLNKIAEREPGTLIVFSFDRLGMINRTEWSDNPKINEAIKNTGSEKIMNIETPYVMLLKENQGEGKFEYIFEYSTFTNNNNDNGIKVLYYSQAEDIKDDGKTFLSHEAAKTQNCFKFVKNYCGLYQQTNPLGRLTTKLNVGNY